MKRQTRLIAVASVSAAAAAVAIPLASGASTRPTLGPNASGPKDELARLTTSHHLSAPRAMTLARRFRVFHRRIGTAADVASVGAASALAKFMATQERLPTYEPSIAVATDADGQPVAVIASANTIKLYSGPAGTNVGTAAQEGGGMGGVSGPRAAVEREGLWELSESASGSTFTDFGLVPNGNVTVTVRNSDGTTQILQVDENVVAVTGSTDGAVPTEAEYTSAAGAVITQRLPRPSQPPTATPGTNK